MQEAIVELSAITSHSDCGLGSVGRYRSAEKNQQHRDVRDDTCQCYIMSCGSMSMIHWTSSIDLTVVLARRKTSWISFSLLALIIM